MIPVAQMVKNLPAMQETWVESLGQEVPLEKGMATHSSILVWGIPWTKESGRLESTGLKESDVTERLTLFFFHSSRKQQTPLYAAIWMIYAR